MAQSASNLSTVLKERWTDDQLQKQFLSDDTPLSRVEKFKATMIGKQAQVPVHVAGASAGYTTTSTASSALNTAGQQSVNQAAFTLITHAQPVSIDLTALNQAGGSNLTSVVSAKNLEIEGAISDLRRQATRAFVTNGDSIVAQCDDTSSSTTVALKASPSGTVWGYDALRRGWLQPGMTVDIGSTSNTDSVVGATTISAVGVSASAPTITIGSSVSTTGGTHNVYIANPNSATAANPEINGLRNIVNTSGALGGLNPATAGQEAWQAASRDTSTTVLSLDLALSLQREVMQTSGKNFTNVWTGLKQQANFYSLLQNQVRFTTDTGLNAGHVDTPTWNNMKIEAFPSILDSDWYCLTLSDFVLITGEITSPTWASDLEGSGGRLRWRQGYTDFQDAVFYPFNVGVRRRNTHAAATGLTA